MKDVWRCNGITPCVLNLSRNVYGQFDAQAPLTTRRVCSVLLHVRPIAHLDLLTKTKITVHSWNKATEFQKVKKSL
jgi:hypothetical protein